MDAKITLSFDAEVIRKAKVFAAKNNLSLSRLTEYIYRNMTTSNYRVLDAIPIAGWVSQVAEGDAVYVRKRRTTKEMKQEYFASKKKKR